MENLVIVESPAKAKTIEKFLGKEYVVKSSYGHIRDLAKKNYGIDVKKNYIPKYEIPLEKKKIVNELKKYVQKVKTVWLACDEDREGEAIAWHLAEVLNLQPEKTKRIVFHEITKEAIWEAIKNPRSIDKNLVDAQQARRILDRLVGFELSPILWKKVKPALSAGRVQSVAVRLIVEREREIMNFVSTSYFKITAYFSAPDKNGKLIDFKADLQKKIETIEEAIAFLEKCKNAQFTISNILTEPIKKYPAPPFTTSTLQQEASRKLGFSVSQTMTIAQRLYESGFITYMRTDSVNLSALAIGTAKNEIITQFGEKYHKTRNYQTKTKGAQEAHEAIRPTYITNQTINGTDQENKLYELIWKRTIASQMTEAEFEKTTVTLTLNTTNDNFIASGEVMQFDGFLKVYIESTDDETEENAKGLLPALTINNILKSNEIQAVERFTHHAPRYTEASLVRRLEELGIGRPSTYAPIISTIQERGYVTRENRKGTNRDYQFITLKDGLITQNTKTETIGFEKAKLFPTDIGMLVNDFLLKYFDDILDYNFTAGVEKDFDEIAQGKLVWNTMIDRFYKPFHEKVKITTETSERTKGERVLGTDPTTGKIVSVKIGKYGPLVQLGDSSSEDKPRFVSLKKGQHIESITLEEALELFQLPRKLGDYENSEVVVALGKFGPYVRHNSKFYALKRGLYDPYSLTLDEAIEVINKKREADKNKVLKAFENNPELFILKGRWGAYISYKKKNYKLPKELREQIDSITIEDCMQIIEEEKQISEKN